MKYFTIKELTRSCKAEANGIDNSPSSEHMNNLARLTNNILDLLRQAWGSPITVNSGYRNKEVNELAGGATNSKHMFGEAADITTGNKKDNEKLFNLAIKLNLPFDQLIDEKGYQWIHISHREKNNRKEILHLK